MDGLQVTTQFSLTPDSNECPADVHDCSNNYSTHSHSLCDSSKQFDSGCVSYHIGSGPSYVAIASSVLSCLGSLAIVLAFIIFKDIRNGMAQRIITALAVADFISATGYIVGSINYIVFFDHLNKTDCTHFQIICKVQAFFTSWSSMSSFAWTAILAVYFYLVVAYQKQRPFHSTWQQITLHIISWAAPGLIVIPFTAMQFLGYAPYAASNWCFVEDPNIVHSNNDSNVVSIIKTTAKVLAAGKLWEILTYLTVIVVYTHIVCILEKMMRSNYARPDRRRVERKMIFIPLIFLLLRIWGTTEFFLNIGMQATYPMHKGCIQWRFWIANVVLGYLQAIGDPGQGWGNAILYVLLSDTIRKRMITDPLRRCCRSLAYTVLDHTYHSIDGVPEDGGLLEYTPQDENKGQEVPQVSRRQNIQRHNSQTCSTISITAAGVSQSGPLNVAQPGTSPVNKLDRGVEPATLNNAPVALHA